MHISLIENKEEWNKFVIKNSNDEFLQSWEWGEFQQSYGRRVWRFAVKEQDKTLAQAMTICMPLPGGKTYVYIPRGPVWKHGIKKETSELVLSMLTQNWRLIALESNAFFISLEPGLRSGADETTKNKPVVDFLISRGWKKTKHIQPEYTSVVDLRPSEDDILKNMHHKTRYNIRLSQKKDLNKKAE